MKTISREKITETWNRVCDLNEPQTDALVKEFMEQQPALGIYVAASAEELEGGAQNSSVLDLLLACWLAMREENGGKLSQLTPDQIDAAESANQAFLEKLGEDSEFEWENAVRGLLQQYNQRDLMAFGIEVLMSPHEEAPELAPEEIGLELLCFKTVLDCLDQ